MKMSNKVYDILKDCALIYFPAAATLYFTLASVWSWPYAGEVVATTTAICTFMGACLKISSVQYNKEN